MTPSDKLALIAIHGHLAKARDTGNKNHTVEAVRLMGEREDFREFISANSDKCQWPPKTARDLDVVTFLFLMMWLYRRDYEAGATICWGPETFTCEPNAVKMVWNAVASERLVNLLGAASMSKTYGPSAWMLLDWVLDPEWTLVRVMSTKEEHVKKNLFADIQRLYLNSVVPLPGKSDTESIATENGKKSGQGIFMIVIPRGSDAGGTIKGSKIKPRPEHPLFGTSSRTRLLIDEAQEVQESAFDEVPNLFSSIEEGDNEHTKIVMAANPKDEFSRYGKNCVPVQGWEGIRTRDSGINVWTSTTGWHCVRLNAMLSENVVQGKTIYPRFFTLNGYKMKLRDANGDPNHPLIWSEVYGMFPPKGMLSAIIQKHWVDKSYGEWVFESQTIPGAAKDVAYTGDNPSMATGRAGRAVAWVDFQGNRHELPSPRWVIQVDAVGVIPRGDTQESVDENFTRLKPLGVIPRLFAIDRTGVGQGEHDIMRRQWREKMDGLKNSTEVVDITGINYSEKATIHRVIEEDTKTPEELYAGIRSELWYVSARFFEYDCIRIGRGVTLKTIEQLVHRQGGPMVGKGKLLSVESKADYKSRNNSSSPDEADAFTMLIQCFRLNIAELLPKAPDTAIEKPRPPSIFDPASQPGMRMGPAIDMGFALDNTGGIEVFKD